MPYFGSQKDREIIRAYELACPRNAPPRFNVVLTSPDCVSRETGVLSPFKFAVAVVDEAHKLKSRASKFFKQFVELTGILGKKKAPWRLLLTGECFGKKKGAVCV